MNLFTLGCINSRRYFVADIDLGDEDPWAVTRGEIPVASATAAWFMGAAQPEAWIETGAVHPNLFSPALVLALRQIGATGWATYPVALTGKWDEPLATYYGLVVHGRCGPIDESRSVRVVREYPAGRFTRLRGLFFDESSWDGSDFFMPRDRTGWIFVTRRIRDVIAARVRHAGLEHLYEVETTPFP